MLLSHAPQPHIGEAEAEAHLGEHFFHLADLLLAVGIMVAWASLAVLLGLAMSGAFTSSMDHDTVVRVRRLHRGVRRQHAARVGRST